MRRWVSLLAAGVFAHSVPAQAAPPQEERAPIEGRRHSTLVVDVPTTAALAAGALAFWGATELARGELAPSSCRWCEPPTFDRYVRGGLAWSDAGAAGLVSDVLEVAAPAAMAGADFLLAGRDLRRASEDVLVAIEAVSIAAASAQIAKFGAARRRPAAWAAGRRTSADDDRAFYSGHVATAFAAAGAFGTVARLRGYRPWPTVYAAGFGAATLIAYLRMAADEHWLTDVAAAAAVGTALGFAVPLLLHRGSSAPKLCVAPFARGAAGLMLSGRM